MESTLTQPEDNTTNNRWRFPKLEWPFGQKAAKIHAIETRERYWILRREVEHYIDRPARELNIHDWRLEKNNNNEEVKIEQPAFAGNNKGYEEKALYSVAQLTSGPLWRVPARIIKNIFYFCVNLIASNQLYYIFFAGFTGGIFSLMMEFQPRNELPGDEIYTSWYYRTRPVIGAFGAMVMYIIIVSPAFSGSLGSIISDGIIKELTSQPLSSTCFTFDLIPGFTERILLPKLI